MNGRRGTLGVLGMALLYAAQVLGAEGQSKKALWIDLHEGGDRRTTIALTEEIARALVESKEMTVNFHESGTGDLITREMLRDVLDGTEESITARDPEDGSEAELYMKDLHYPATGEGAHRLVLETYKDGRHDLRIVLPELEISASGESEGEFARLTLGWKGFLPFLEKTGGAVYIHDHKDNTEVYLYVD